MVGKLKDWTNKLLAKRRLDRYLKERPKTAKIVNDILDSEYEFYYEQDFGGNVILGLKKGSTSVKRYFDQAYWKQVRKSDQKMSWYLTILKNQLDSIIKKENK